LACIVAQKVSWKASSSRTPLLVVLNQLLVAQKFLVDVTIAVLTQDEVYVKHGAPLTLISFYTNCTPQLDFLNDDVDRLQLPFLYFYCCTMSAIAHSSLNE
jgi:hypothetical protein